jgi:hypothetical protein
VRGLIVIAALALASCTPAQTAGCDYQATHEFSFGGEAAEDTITAQSIGPSCDKAIGLYTVRDREGFPIWSWSAPLKHAFGDVFAAEDEEYVQSFLDRWVQPTLATTASAPAYETLTPGQTTLDRLTYEDVRARDLPMLCHFSGTARQICVFWEPAAGGAGHLLDRAVEETNL